MQGCTLRKLQIIRVAHEILRDSVGFCQVSEILLGGSTYTSMNSDRFACDTNLRRNAGPLRKVEESWELLPIRLNNVHRMFYSSCRKPSSQASSWVRLAMRQRNEKRRSTRRESPRTKSKTTRRDGRGGLEFFRQFAQTEIKMLGTSPIEQPELESRMWQVNALEEFAVQMGRGPSDGIAMDGVTR